MFRINLIVYSELGFSVEHLNLCLILLADKLAFDFVGRSQLTRQNIYLVWQDGPLFYFCNSVDSFFVCQLDTLLNVLKQFFALNSLINRVNIAKLQLRFDKVFSLC